MKKTTIMTSLAAATLLLGFTLNPTAVLADDENNPNIDKWSFANVCASSGAGSLDLGSEIKSSWNVAGEVRYDGNGGVVVRFRNKSPLPVSFTFATATRPNTGSGFIHSIAWQPIPIEIPAKSYIEIPLPEACDHTTVLFARDYHFG